MNEKKRWDALTPEQKRAEKEAPLLADGVKKCPRCGAIARIRYSYAEKYEFMPTIFVFGQADVDKLDDIIESPPCLSHAHPRACRELSEKRFVTFEEARDYWNNLIA